MKFIITGDWHLTKKTPENRLDDYATTALDKVKFILLTAHLRSDWRILQPGDLFDYAGMPYDVTANLAHLIRSFGHITSPIISVEGQHDVHFHNLENKNNPHHMLVSDGMIHRPQPRDDYENDVVVYGAGWGEEIPEITTPGKFNILLTHRMVIKDRRGKIWAGQEEYEFSSKLLRETAFNVIVSGDNHQSFIAEDSGKLLFNCGSLLRSTTAQAGHKPYIVFLDTEKPEDYEIIYIPIQPFEEVMDMEKKERAELRDEKLDMFIVELKKAEARETDYKSNVYALLKSSEASEGTKNIIQQIMEGVI
jgi:DNA repair exonuclease SbcCD nuclease subunit